MSRKSVAGVKADTYKTVKRLTNALIAPQNVASFVEREPMTQTNQLTGPWISFANSVTSVCTLRLALKRIVEVN